MKNLFENAKFGDKFVTRNGEVLLFVGCFIGDDCTVWRILICEDETEVRYYQMDGKAHRRNRGWDIVSKYKEK